ncbi:uncharacterized protein [Rutidosis leptorrhynchoides]|uniref:uncharacterized protein n=1 Tax=Rutidosis leptorrhynchoides TaxID=125765 RepID=UPI003A9A5CBC
MAKSYSSNSTYLETFKNNLVPKKVEVFVWRARNERLLVLSELDKRGIDLHSVLCPLCDSNIESVSHSLLTCDKVQDVWEKVREWWGFDSTNLSFDNLLRGLVPSSCSELGGIIWQAVEWISCYLIWRNRNQNVFKKTTWTTPNALNEIQVKSYDWIAKRCKRRKIDWIAKRCKRRKIDWHDWLHNPKSFLV